MEVIIVGPKRGECRNETMSGKLSEAGAPASCASRAGGGRGALGLVGHEPHNNNNQWV